MSDNFEYILPPWEAEMYVEKLQVSKLEEVGTATWFEYHKTLMHLDQQSILEITNMREETIKEWFVNFQKVPILIYEAIQISVWKQKVFPLLIELKGEPSNTFMMYSILYHEIIAVSLLENILFHCDSVASLDDSALDLIDYAVNNIMPIIFTKDNLDVESIGDSCLEELLQKKKEIAFAVGIRCISILGYFATCLDNLPLSVLKRMLTTHDVPYLFAQLIEKQPWKKNNPDGDALVYSSTWEKVKTNEEDKICKVEGQVWIGLRELLLNPKCAPYYEITEFRMSELIKLQKYLYERVLDQIAPLIDLRRWLSYLNVSLQPSSNKQVVSVEIIPQIRSTIMEKHHKKWKKLAKLQSETLYTKDIDYIKEMAQVLNTAYDLDKIVLHETNKCALCKGTASKRCSKCKSIWYCGRECQVKDWTTHKDQCDQIIMDRNVDNVDD